MLKTGTASSNPYFQTVRGAHNSLYPPTTSSAPCGLQRSPRKPPDCPPTPRARGMPRPIRLRAQPPSPQPEGNTKASAEDAAGVSPRYPAGGSKMSVRDAQKRARKWTGPPSPLPISTSPEIQKAWSGRRPGRAHNVTTDRLAAKGPSAVSHSVFRIWMCFFFNDLRVTLCGKTVNKTELS